MKTFYEMLQILEFYTSTSIADKYDWGLENNKQQFIEWEKGVLERLSINKDPRVKDMINKSLNKRAFEAAKSKIENDTSRQLEGSKKWLKSEILQGKFANDFSKVSGTWADGLSPNQLATYYFILYGEKLPKPEWIDSHSQTNGVHIYKPYDR